MSTHKLMAHITEHKPKSKRIITLTDPTALSSVTEFIPTGCPPLDLIMGGGVPVGRMTEIYGDTSTGKSLLAAHILAEAQAMDAVAVLLDSETAIDAGVLVSIGVDNDNLIYSNPETVEEVYEDIMDVMDAKGDIIPDGIMVIVWDSVAATSSDEEIEKVRKEGLGARTVATHARLISKMCRVMKKMVARNNIALVLINQTRETIGVLYGPKKSTFGGRAIGYYSSVRLELAYIRPIKDRGIPIGIEARAYVAKNKVAPPFGKCEFPIIFDHGIDEPGSVLWWLKNEKLVRTAGSWYYMELEDGTELRFQRPGWPDVYNDNRDAILDMMMETT